MIPQAVGEELTDIQMRILPGNETLVSGGIIAAKAMPTHLEPDPYYVNADDCSCTISLKPIPAPPYTWLLKAKRNPRAGAAPADIHALLTVGCAWSEGMILCVRDNHSNEPSVAELPESIRTRLATPNIIFTAELPSAGAEAAEQTASVISAAGAGKPADRVVGHTGRYIVSVMSVHTDHLEAYNVPNASAAQFLIDLRVGEYDHFTPRCTLPNAEPISDRAMLPSGCITVDCVDEGENLIATPIGRHIRYALAATSHDVHSTNLDGLLVEDAGGLRFRFDGLIVRRRERPTQSQQLQLVLKLAKPHGPREEKILRIGNGFKQSARIVEVQNITLESADVGTTFHMHTTALGAIEVDAVDAGTPIPRISFNLGAHDGSVPTGLASAAMQVKHVLPGAANPDPDPFGACTLSGQGAGSMQPPAAARFEHAGLHTLRLVYTEQRTDWRPLLHPSELTVSKPIRFNVRPLQPPPGGVRYKLFPEPDRQLFQNNDPRQSIHDQLYYVEQQRPVPYVSRLHQVDEFENPLPDPFTLTLHLVHRGLGSLTEITLTSSPSGELAVPATFITDTFLRQPQVQLVPATYDVAIDHPGGACLLSFSFTTNARRDQLIEVRILLLASHSSHSL